MMTRFLILILAAFLIQSCEKNNLYTEGIAGDLVGSWINPEYNDTLISYRRALYIPDNQMGVIFNSDGSLVERSNAGFCGTPPITYADYNGNWSVTDSILTITTDFWGGSINSVWRIISITETRFSYSVISQDINYEE